MAAQLLIAGAASAMPQGPLIPDHLAEISFADLEGWDRDDHRSALKSFLRFCRSPGNAPDSASPNAALRFDPAGRDDICAAASDALKGDAATTRRFFESRFTPYRIDEPGFVTGYYEPEVPASRTRTSTYTVPLHRKPSGLEAVTPDTRPADWPDHLSHGRRTGGVLAELPDRGEIMDGALDDESLELAWLADPVDAFFIHVQGSARLRLADGSIMRVGYAGKSGHPYTGIGKLLVTRGEGTPEDFTMTGLRAWLAAHPERRDALLKENRSYIFFREVTETAPELGPVGGAGLPLTPGRSLAVDTAHIPYGALVFVSAGFSLRPAESDGFQRLMVADDTGSAIRGRARGDIFVGSGADAGETAGNIRHRAAFTVLVPRPVPPGSQGTAD